MSDAVATVETVAADIGEHLTAGAAAVVEPKLEPELASAEEVTPFEFNEPFQTKIAALTMRDPTFVAATHHLLQPGYFENQGEALLVNLLLRYYAKYRRLPDPTTLLQLIKDDSKAKIIRAEHLPLVVAALKKLRVTDIADRDFAIDKVAEFARHQAVAKAIYDSVGLLEKKRFDKIEGLIKQAVEIAAENDSGDYDFFSNISQRTDVRLDKASGALPPTGIPTGVLKMDERLYHRGWGRKELTVLLGGAKAGKTMALINFAKSAALLKRNVLYVTLEVSRDIICDRLDACITDTMMTELSKHIHDVNNKVKSLVGKSGRLEVREYPTGAFSPRDLRRLIERYRSKGVQFDLVVVDYADIMAPSHRTDDPIENSKGVYMELRALAIEENLAMLTATQTNRTGYTAAVAKAEHVAEDFNKVRLADLMISINASDDERAKGEARLYFTASRNQESGFTMLVKQDRSRMQFIQSVISIE